MISHRLTDILVSLESGARPKGGVSADTGEIPSIGGEHLDSSGGFNFTSMKRVPRSFYESLRLGRIEAHDILVVKDGATTGKTSFIGDDFPFKEAAINEHVFRLKIDSTKASPKYVFHFLRSNVGQSSMMLDFRGATVGGISRGFADKTKITLPPLSEQKRIAEILDRAESLRRQRRAALALLDELTQSIFLDMFGDPVSNPMGWPTKSLSSLGKVTTGGTPSSTKDGMFGGAVPFVTPGDLETDEAPKRTLSKQGASEAKTVRAGATFVCCIGATIGKMGQASVRSAFNQQLNAIEWTSSVDDDFGLGVLRFFKKLIATLGASTTLPILKKSSFEKIEIPVPPIESQAIFAKRKSEIEKLKTRHRNSSHELGQLFASLQHRAFRGEL